MLNREREREREREYIIWNVNIFDEKKIKLQYPFSFWKWYIIGNINEKLISQFYSILKFIKKNLYLNLIVYI